MTALRLVAAWLRVRVDVADLVGMVGLITAYSGARDVFGPGWARLGLGLFLVAVYVVASFRVMGGRTNDPR